MAAVVGRARPCAIVRGSRAWSCAAVVRGRARRARSVVCGRAWSYVVVRGRAWSSITTVLPLRGQHCRAARFAASTAVARNHAQTHGRTTYNNPLNPPGVGWVNFVFVLR